MGNNRKDMTDQTGKGGTVGKMGRDTVRVEEKERCSCGCKTVCLRVPFNQQRKHWRIG